MVKELCRHANEEKTFALLKTRRAKETLGPKSLQVRSLQFACFASTTGQILTPEALQAQFSACKIKDIVENARKHGMDAPNFHRIQMAEEEKQALARKAAMKQKFRGAGKRIMLASLLDQNRVATRRLRNHKQTWLKKEALSLLGQRQISVCWARHNSDMILPLVPECTSSQGSGYSVYLLY